MLTEQGRACILLGVTTLSPLREGDVRMFAMSSSARGLLLLCLLASPACGGSSTRTSAPKSDGGAGQATAGAASGAAPTDGGAGQAGIGADSGAGGVAGGGGAINVITSEPKSCETDDGRDGIIVDIFPYPSPAPRCEPLNQVGTPDEACPEEQQVRCAHGSCLLEAAFGGCCLPSGICGLWDPGGRFGTEKALGCIDRTPWIDNSYWLDREERQVVTCTAK